MILKESLSGNGKTIMIVNVCQDKENLFQTKETLKFTSKISN